MNSVFGEGSVEDHMIHEQGRRPINCDQVSWLLTSIESYIPDKNGRGCSREREMKKYALLYEIMDLANLHFEDDAAQRNGTPPDVRRFRFASKSEELELLVNTPCPKSGHTDGFISSLEAEIEKLKIELTDWKAEVRAIKFEKNLLIKKIVSLEKANEEKNKAREDQKDHYRRTKEDARPYRDSGLNPLKQEGAPVHPAEMNWPMTEENYQKQLKRYTDWYGLDEAKK